MAETYDEGVTLRRAAEMKMTDISGRLESLDAMRGFDMLFIMGFALLVSGICKACGCGDGFWLIEQMKHPEWIGVTQHDTIFPTFLFIAGMTFPFSLARQLEKGRSRAAVALKVVKRAAVLFLLGMVFERYFMGSPFRFGSVLGRIGIAWACAAGLYLVCGVRTRIAVAIALLLGYWAINLSFVAPDHPDCGIFTPQGNIVCWIDRTLIAPLGRISPGTERLPFDNQTFLSNMTAVVTAMLGMFTGEFVRAFRNRMSGNRMTLILLGASAALAASGWFVAHGCGRWSFPFSKVLWSPSFTLVVGAYSVALFAVFFWLIDVRKCWRRTLFFLVIGLNPIAIYLAQPILGFGRVNEYFFGRLAGLFPEPMSGLVLSATYVMVCWLFLLFLHRNKIYLKV